MLFLVAIAYLLLCVRLRVQIDLSIDGMRGGVVFTIGAWGVRLRHEAVIARKKQGIGFALEPRKKPKREKNRTAVQRAGQNLMKRYLQAVLRSRGFECLTLHVRLGLGDALETAVAAGAIYAALCALAAPVVQMQGYGLRVTPDFSGTCLQIHGQGIFFCQPGDIMLAALKAARRKRREGLKWTSIPLRA